MKTIHKYEIIPAVQFVRMPQGAKILSAGTQGSQVFIWALVDTEVELSEPREICVGGTGTIYPSDIDTAYDFLDTVQMVEDGKIFQFHVFVGRE